MAPNLPPSITVNRNLAATLKNYIKANGGKNVSESELNNILQKVAKFDSERDAGTREGGSIFSGGSKYLGGSGKDFVVNQGQQIQLSTEEFNEIFKGYIDPIKSKETEKPPVTPELSTPSLSEDLKPAIPDKIDTPNAAKKQQTEAMLDSVDGKIIERQVNGTKQKIAVATVDGQKVRRAVNEDGSLGENLVTISTAGKNKYITQSEMDKRIKNVFPEGLPEGITASFVSIGGTPTLVFKKDGKTLDPAQIKEYALKAQEEQVENFDNQLSADEQAEINDIENMQPKIDDAISTGDEITGEGELIEAQAPVEAPVTGPVEGENPQYDAAVRGNENPVKQSQYTYENDKTYQSLNSRLQDLEAKIAKFEKDNNITESNRFSDADAMFAEGYTDYSSNKYIYQGLKEDFDSYKNVMENWKDGKISPRFTAHKTTNGHTVLDVNYTNVERITLKNGQRAYKTDQGTFYPYNDGNPGNVKVPEELL